METLLQFLHFAPALLGLGFQCAHILDAVISTIRQYPGAFIALAIVLAATVLYIWNYHPEMWDALWASPLEGKVPGSDAEREAIEAMVGGEDNDGSHLADRIHRWTGPAVAKATLLRKLRNIEKPGPFGIGAGPSSQSDQADRQWIERVLQVPLGRTTPLPDAPPTELLRRAKERLDQTLLGQTEVKIRLLEVLSSWLRRPEAAPPVIGLRGPPGVGKTTIARCISEVLRRPCQTICFGGRKDSSELKGHSPTYVGAQWGAIVQALVDASAMDPILYLDEVDKIGGMAFGAGGTEVYHVLLHATDPTQNTNFQDAYLPGIPIDLSRVLFVVSANETEHLPKPLIDRIQWVDMEGYDLATQFDILEQSLWPAVLTDLGVAERFRLTDDGAQCIVEASQQAGEGDVGGVRKVRQLLETVLRRAALLQDLRETPALLQEMGWTHPVPEGAWTMDCATVASLLEWTSSKGSQPSS